MTAATPIDDGLWAPAPRAAYFDEASGAWVVSRYVDVLRAFRDASLWPVSSKWEESPDARNERGGLVARGPVREALSAQRLAEWHEQMTSVARETLAALPTDRAIELLGQFAKPWCMSVALLVTGTDKADRQHLSDLGDDVFAGNGEPTESPQKIRAMAAVAEMQRYFESSRVPMAQATFIGISQTMPRLLANGWLALFRHPGEVARLRAQPELMPRAVEELLRYAGIIPRLFRKARANADLEVFQLAAGERVTLMIASANRDPERFPDPDRLDVSRRPAGELALGIGHNSCAGARLIRTANAVAIGALLDAFADVSIVDAVPWRTGAGFVWPASVHIRTGQRRDPISALAVETPA
jgi:cytochrome P450